MVPGRVTALRGSWLPTAITACRLMVPAQVLDAGGALDTRTTRLPWAFTESLPARQRGQARAGLAVTAGEFFEAAFALERGGPRS